MGLILERGRWGSVPSPAINTMTMSKLDRKLITIMTATVMLLVALMLVPFPMIVARNCTIRVVDSVGKPWPNAKISRGWAFGSSESLSEKQTGPDGVITFGSLAERHSLLGRCFALVANVVFVHGNAHISDEYLIKFPEGWTADIQGETSFQWVYEEGHFAKIDLSGLPRGKRYDIQFTIRKKVT